MNRIIFVVVGMFLLGCVRSPRTEVELEKYYNKNKLDFIQVQSEGEIRVETSLIPVFGGSQDKERSFKLRVQYMFPNNGIKNEHIKELYEEVFRSDVGNILIVNGHDSIHPDLFHLEPAIERQKFNAICVFSIEKLKGKELKFIISPFSQYIDGLIFVYESKYLGIFFE